jgi:hypothetical protein
LEAGAARRPGGIGKIARLIIEILARVYDLGIGDRLEYYAPLLSKKKSRLD